MFFSLLLLLKRKQGFVFRTSGPEGCSFLFVGSHIQLCRCLILNPHKGEDRESNLCTGVGCVFFQKWEHGPFVPILLSAALEGQVCIIAALGTVFLKWSLFVCFCSFTAHCYLRDWSLVGVPQGHVKGSRLCGEQTPSKKSGRAEFLWGTEFAFRCLPLRCPPAQLIL